MKRTERTQFRCADCGWTGPRFVAGEMFGNYAVLPNRRRVCRPCAGIRDSKNLSRNPKRVGLYLDSDGASVTNFPGTFRRRAYSVSKTCGGFCGRSERVHVWFRHDGAEYYATGPGRGMYLSNVRRLKARKG